MKRLYLISIVILLSLLLFSCQTEKDYSSLSVAENKKGLEAAEVYEEFLSKNEDEKVRWNYVYSLYEAEEYDGALEEIDKNIDTSGFLGEVIKNIDKSGIKNAWNGAVLKKRDDLCFNAEDADTVSMLSSRLGMTDCENQVKNIAYVKNMLDIHIKSARYDADKLCRLYSGGGLLAGAFLIMMFL